MPVTVILSLIFGIIAAASAATATADLEALREETVFAAPGDGARSYQRTERGNFAKSNFLAEVTVTIHGGGGSGCAFFGMGRGEANPQTFYEPSTMPAVYLRIAPSDFAGGQLLAGDTAIAGP